MPYPASKPLQAAHRCGGKVKEVKMENIHFNPTSLQGDEPLKSSAEQSGPEKSKEESLSKRVAKVINRCREENVSSIKTAKGLRKLRDNIDAMIKEINKEITLEKETMDQGDDLDHLASTAEIEAWSKKKTKFQDGLDLITDRVSALMQEKKDESA